jgi:2-amino-4-hydroxy-6-hydroxymethyldihydropteridine diphosphokinase
MATIYLALGSNLGESKQHIEKAIELMQESVYDIKQAPMYISKAVGYTKQPDFYNTAISGSTNLSPLELLGFVKSIEKEVGRIKRFRWGPREIDIDIIFYDHIILQSETLNIPHPSFIERDFVLQPLNDLCPQLIDPKSKKPIKSILKQLPAKYKSQLRRLT